MRRTTGAAVLSVLAALALAGCGSAWLGAGDPYPLPAEPPHSAESNRILPGEVAHGHVLYLTARPGDRIELLGAEAMGTEPLGPLEMVLSRGIVQDDGSWLLGDPDHLEPLEGAVIEGIPAPSGEPFAIESTVLLVAQVTADRAGRMDVTNVRLRYRVNGGEIREGTGISAVWAVCAADPLPDDCEMPPY